MNELLHDFISYAASEKGLSPRTIEAYRSDIDQFIEEIKPKTLLEVKEETIVAFLSKLHAKQFATSSISRVLVSLKVFFKFLKREQVITENPTQFLTSPKLWQLIPEVLTIEEMEQLLQAPDQGTFNGMRDRAILEVLYGSGLRVSEVCGLTLYSIDDACVRVFGKGSRERIVPIGKRALEAVDLWLTTYRAQFDSEKNLFLFLTRRGKSINRQVVWRTIKEYGKKAGITKNISPHTLRHNFATHLLDRGADLRIIQEMLGHCSINSTDRYTQISKARLLESFDTFHPNP